MSARDAVLGRIRAALTGAPAPAAARRADRQPGSAEPGELRRRFVERLEELGASVVVTADPVAAVEEALRLHDARTVIVPPDFPAHLRPEQVLLIQDDGRPAGALDLLDGALTLCAAACAETGTIAVDGGPGQGRRAISLVPDLYVCVVGEEQIVQTVPELFARLHAAAVAGRPVVLVSGPSATSDIELNRVEGVHGPRRLVVVVAAEGALATAH